MTVSTDLTLINDISSFKLGHGVTFVCDVSSLTSTYDEFKLYSVSNNELTELADVSDNITNGLLVYKFYPQSTGTLSVVLCTEEVSDTSHQSNTVQLSVNNNAHAANIFNANAALVANLTAMGVVGASTNDGLATNIAKVTDIPPTQRGINLDTSITCTAPASASVGVPFNITGVLTSSYDDTSATNVDMHGGELQGATVEIYNGNTLLGSCTTNIGGEYTFSYTPTATGILTIKAIYDSANDFYEDSASNSSSVSVHVVVSSVTLTTDKNILSYVDNEYATLTATVLDSNDDPIVGETVSFDIVDHDTGTVVSNIGTATTNSNGECSVYYLSKHTSTINIKASCNNIESSSVQIDDLWVYDTGATDKSSKFGTPTIILLDSNATLVHDSTNGYYIVTKTTNNGLVNIPITGITGVTDITLEFDIYVPSSQGRAVNGGFGVGTVGFYQLGGNNSPATSNIYDGGDILSANTGHYENEWISHKVVISSTGVVWTAKRSNNSEIINRTWNVNISSNTPIGLSVGYHTSAYAYFKNIKVSPSS